MPKTETKDQQIDWSTKNLYQKLIAARRMFLDCGATKTGKHMQLTFMYFELQDIVPNATRIFEEVGLIAIPQFNENTVSVEIVNVDKPEETKIVSLPYKKVEQIISNTGKVVTNEIQTMGSMITYYRRYLWLIVLDIVESDTIDPNTGNIASKDDEVTQTTSSTIDIKKPTKPRKSNKPASSSDRKEIVAEVTQNNQKPADELQINALKDKLSELLALDDSEDMEEKVAEIVTSTDEFRSLSYSDCEQLINLVDDLISKYNTPEAK